MASLSSSCLAAAQEAESGAWLDLLEQHISSSSSSASSGGADGVLLPAVAPPGLKQGHFGAWRLPEEHRPTGGGKTWRRGHAGAGVVPRARATMKMRMVRAACPDAEKGMYCHSQHAIECIPLAGRGLRAQHAQAKGSLQGGGI